MAAVNGVARLKRGLRDFRAISIFDSKRLTSFRAWICSVKNVIDEDKRDNQIQWKQKVCSIET